MAGNEQRGDVEITLNDKKYILRPSFEAIAKIEARTGKGIYGICSRWVNNVDIGMAEAAIVIEESIKASGDEPPRYVGQCIQRQGLSNLVVPLMKLITNAIKGDEKPGDPSGEEQAAS